MKKWLTWGIPAVILIALVVWRFNNRAETNQQTMGQAGQRRGGTAAVELAPATARTITQTLESVANVESPYKVAISPKTSGRINFLEAREGDQVQKGQVLLGIDPVELQAAVGQAQANVAEARSRLAQAKITQGATSVGITSEIRQQQAGVTSAQAELNQVRKNSESSVQAALAQVGAGEAAVRNARASLDREQASLRNAQTRYNRVKSLYEQGFIAAQDVDDAKTAMDVQQGAVAVAQGQVQSAESQLNVQKQNLSIAQQKGKSDVAASQAKLAQSKASLDVARANRAQNPAYRENIAALQASVDAAMGQLQQAQSRLADTKVRSSISGTVTARNADPGALASPGTAVLEVQFLDWLYITASVPIESSALVRKGQTAEISLEAFPGRTFSGPITNVNPAADPTSRQFEIQIRVENPRHEIRPGMYGRVWIVTSQVQADVVVPREAVHTDAQGRSSVTVVDSENVAHVRDVKVGVQDPKGIQILEGVKSGEKVVTLSYSPVRDGQKVSLGKPAGESRGGRGQGGQSGGGGSRQTGGGGATRGGGQARGGGQ